MRKLLILTLLLTSVNTGAQNFHTAINVHKAINDKLTLGALAIVYDNSNAPENNYAEIQPVIKYKFTKDISGSYRVSGARQFMDEGDEIRHNLYLDIKL